MRQRARSAVVAALSGALAPALVALLSGSTAASAADLPEIRITQANPVPACVTPERLMAFLKSRNRKLDPRFKDIARHYKYWGEAWHVRWDYAFFQMAIETNFLSYRRPDGRMGDVDPRQNNFAGIGTTGGGVPGDGFPDVKTGVLAQIQHLVVYSGERLAAPVAPRTKLKQDVILEASLKLRRPVRFSDLSRRWAVDKNYGNSIEWAATSYRSAYCTGIEEAAAGPGDTLEVLPWQKSEKAASTGRTGTVTNAHARNPSNPAPSASAQGAPRLVAAPQAAARPASPARTLWSKNGGGAAIPAETKSTTSAPFDAARTPPSGLGIKPGACEVHTASYGGRKTLLLRTSEANATRYTALTVLDGFEKSMTESFLKSQPAGGETIGEFATRSEAVAKAHALCQRG